MKDAAMLQSNEPSIQTKSVTTGEADRRRKIRELNDVFRQQKQPRAFMLGEFHKAPSVSELPWGEQWAVVEQVKRFAHFDDENDPSNTHDFGAFAHKGNRYFWKIEYMDPKFGKLSDDPSDSQRTVRMLTIHLADVR